MDIKEVAKKLVSDNKGILAADESFGTIEKRFTKLGIESTEENRRAYREILFTTAGIEKYISGVILFDETLRQSTAQGKLFVDVLREKGILPGIKVDQGKVDLPFFPEEFITEGLDGLRERLTEYKSLGAEFTKWRAGIVIGEGKPSSAAVHANAHTLALYAAFAQEAGLTPIVEPEVLMDGNHTIKECEIVTTLTLDEVFGELLKYKVDLAGMLLKPNMVLSGKDAKEKSSVDEIVEATLRVFKKSVPSSVPGIVFLSGGQTPTEATKNLCELNRDKKSDHPWALSFSFGRALQDEAMKAWGGKEENRQNAQSAFLKFAKMDAEARRGVC